VIVSCFPPYERNEMEELGRTINVARRFGGGATNPLTEYLRSSTYYPRLLPEWLSQFLQVSCFHSQLASRIGSWVLPR